MSNPNPSPATRWQKGQSGNPNGVRRRPITAAILKELRVTDPDGQATHLQQAVAKLVALAIAGDVAAFKELANRVEGLPAQPVQHSGPDGLPIRVEEILVHSPPAEPSA